MITHYGLFWSERDVLWAGRRGEPGCMQGRERTMLQRRGAPTRQERLNTQDYKDFVGLYCLYGDGRLLYVGETGLETQQTLFTRLKAHRRGPLSGRWDRFSWFGRETCDGDTSVITALSQLEAIAIAIVNPGFNKQSGTFAGATQVFQVPQEAAEGDLETKLERMTRMMEDIRARLPE